jgi:hypothetical protein
MPQVFAFFQELREQRVESRSDEARTSFLTSASARFVWKFLFFKNLVRSARLERATSWFVG